MNQSGSDDEGFDEACEEFDAPPSRECTLYVCPFCDRILSCRDCAHDCVEGSTVDEGIGGHFDLIDFLRRAIKDIGTGVVIRIRRLYSDPW